MQTKVNIVPSKKLQDMPTYIFAELDEWKDEARKQGVNLIDLGMGNPDGATPQPIVDAAIESIQKPQNHGYPCFKGKKQFREAIAEFLKEKFHIDINPENEIQTLLGAKEGLAHLAMAYTNPGDINIVPDPYYPVHSRGTWISSADVYHLPLKLENDFLPDLNAIPEEVAKKAKIFFVNYPNNPTAAVATREFYEELVDYCIKYNILLCSDLAYSEICFDGYKPLSIFEISRAKEVAIEFHTFSKTYNMAGWRIGYAVGNKEFIRTLCAMKTNIDYGTCSIMQDAGIVAIKEGKPYVKQIVNNYQQRRDFMIEGLNKLSWNLDKTRATMYLWIPVPGDYDSKAFCKMVLDKTGVVLTPGIAFGKYSDKYFRLSLVAPDEKLKEALERFEKAGIRYYK